MSEVSHLLAAVRRARDETHALQAQNDLLLVSNRKLVNENDRLRRITLHAMSLTERLIRWFEGAPDA